MRAIRAEEYTVDCESNAATAMLAGVFRLESAEAYDTLFAPISLALESAIDRYTVDLTGVVLMNSTGIRALADLVLHARRKGTPLVFVGKADIPWQAKAVASLKPLYSRLTVTLT